MLPVSCVTCVRVTGYHDRGSLDPSLSSLLLSVLSSWFSVGLRGDILTILTNWLCDPPLLPSLHSWSPMTDKPPPPQTQDWPHSEKTSLVLCVLRVPTIFFLTVDRSNSRRKFNFLVHTRKIERILNLLLYSCYNVTKYCYLSLKDMRVSLINAQVNFLNFTNPPSLSWFRKV